jgi:hypothetical protein
VGCDLDGCEFIADFLSNIFPQPGQKALSSIAPAIGGRPIETVPQVGHVYFTSPDVPELVIVAPARREDDWPEPAPNSLFHKLIGASLLKWKRP